MTAKSIWKIIGIAFVCFAVCFVFAAISTSGCRSSLFGIKGTSVETFNEEFDKAAISSVDIDFPSGELLVNRSNDKASSFQVVETTTAASGPKTDLVCEVQDGCLKIHYKINPLSWLPIFWFSSSNRTLAVTLPQDDAYQLDSFRLQLSSGKATVCDIPAKKADVQVLSGTANVERLKCSDSTIALSSGNLHVSESDFGNSSIKVSSGDAFFAGSFKKTDVRLSSGRIGLECSNSDLESLTTDVSSGRLTMSLPKDCGFEAAVSKASGSFNCDFDCSVRGEVYTFGDASTPIDIKIASGNVAIKPLAS